MSKQRALERPDFENTLKPAKKERQPMRFMMIVKASEKSGAGTLPCPELMSSMMEYNKKLVDAGVLVDLNALKSSSNGARVKFTECGATSVIEGPFAETKELVAGYWIIEVDSMEGALAWAKKMPFAVGLSSGEEMVLEVRPVFSLEDFPPHAAIEEAREIGKHL